MTTTVTKPRLVLTERQASVLDAVRAHQQAGQDATVSRIASSLGLTKGAVSWPLNRLRNAGLVEHPERQAVTITYEGLKELGHWCLVDGHVFGDVTDHEAHECKPCLSCEVMRCER